MKTREGFGRASGSFFLSSSALVDANVATIKEKSRICYSNRTSVPQDKAVGIVPKRSPGIRTLSLDKASSNQISVEASCHSEVLLTQCGNKLRVATPQQFEKVRSIFNSEECPASSASSSSPLSSLKQDNLKNNRNFQSGVFWTTYFAMRAFASFLSLMKL